MITDAQKWLLLACLALAGWLLYLLGPVLTPFAVSALLAYLCDPVVDRIEERKVSRTLAVVIVFSCMLLMLIVALLVLIPLLEDQLLKLVSRIPQLLTWTQESLLPLVVNKFGLDVSQINLDQIRTAGRKDKASGIDEVAKKFESMFVHMMLKAMRDANKAFEEDNPLNTFESGFRRDMYDQQLSVSLTQGRGIGLADSLARQIGIAWYLHDKDDRGDYLVDHSASVFLIDPEGRLLAVFSAPHEQGNIRDRFLKIREFYERQS